MDSGTVVDITSDYKKRRKRRKGGKKEGRGERKRDCHLYNRWYAMHCISKSHQLCTMYAISPKAFLLPKKRATSRALQTKTHSKHMSIETSLTHSNHHRQSHIHKWALIKIKTIDVRVGRHTQCTNGINKHLQSVCDLTLDVCVSVWCKLILIVNNIIGL